MDTVSYPLHAGAAVAIMFAWYRITALRKRIPGGIVRATCNLLGQFIGLIALACLALSFSSLLPDGFREPLVALVFVLAAAFAITVINFFSEFAEDSGF